MLNIRSGGTLCWYAGSRAEADEFMVMDIREMTKKLP